jgi:Ssu72-like protein
MCVCAQALKLAQMLEAAQDWPAQVHDILAAFEEQTQRSTLYSIVFF